MLEKCPQTGSDTGGLGKRPRTCHFRQNESRGRARNAARTASTATAALEKTMEHIGKANVKAEFALQYSIYIYIEASGSMRLVLFELASLRTARRVTLFNRQRVAVSTVKRLCW